MAQESGKTWLTWLLVIVALVAIAAAAYFYLNPRVKTVTTTKFQKVPEIRTVETVRRVYVPCPEKGVVALDKAAVAEKLGLGWLKEGPATAPAFANRSAATAQTGPTYQTTRTDLAQGAAAPNDDFDEAQLQAETPPVPGRPADLQVTATAELPESRNGYDVIGIFNTRTGITDLLPKEKPSPWFEFRNRYGLGIRYGVGLGNGQPLHTGTFYGFWEFLRVKDLYATGYGEVTSDAVGKAQIDMQWRPN